MNIANFKKFIAYHTFNPNNNLGKHLKYLKSQKVLITVDDGHLSFCKNAFPLLKQYQIPTFLFIIPSLINTEIPFWWDEVMYYLGNEKGSKELQRLKLIPNQERLDYLEELRDNSELPPLKQQQLTVAQLKEMQETGIMIANHSFTHPMFDQCTEEELRDELRKTKAFFEKYDLKGYEYFAYPNGNYNELAEKVLIEEGVKYAFLFNHQLNRGKVNPMRISRLSVNDDTPLWKFRFILSGWHSKVLPLRKRLFRFLKR
ncbi:polysaccharide deacetylase family protein [Marivirga arenosa]|uniref:Polysaccharide deacetylase family protein n=1 Tax=Marivirga arenosa TaxID=3059076 RepID=A0AA49GFH6_9BACT|nr:polysaccharide deacetylase family protein [Marivirga sp. ABR2-2]WKK84213.1 polysaccharide deacetylase family protein [Marivirga sp. ABR2-2]